MANITNSTDGIWFNADSLRVKMGRAEANKAGGGEYNALTSTHVTEFNIDDSIVALGTADTAVYVLDFGTVFPDGAVIEKVEIHVGEAWDSSDDNFKLNVGLVKASDFDTIVDADGLVNSLAQTAMDTAGAIVEINQEANSTGAGALLGTALAYDSVVCVYLETTAPNAGSAKLRLFWRTAA